MGKIARGVLCSVSGCGEKAVKSLSAQRVARVLKVKAERGRVYLCEEHYKEFKKKTREERRLEKWRHMNI